jgi:hypothetical protein
MDFGDLINAARNQTALSYTEGYGRKEAAQVLKEVCAK